MRQRFSLALAVTLWFSGAALGETKPPAPANLVANGGFEQSGAGWQFLSTGANATGAVDAAEKHEGKYSYKLTNKSGYAPNLYARITQQVSGLRPYTTYQVSCWAKGLRCGVNWIGGGRGWTIRKQFPQGDFDWQEFSFEINTDDAPENFELMVLTESQTGALWVDDIRFEPVKVDQAKQEAVDAEIFTRADNLRRRVEDLKKRIRGNPAGHSHPVGAGVRPSSGAATSKLQMHTVNTNALERSTVAAPESEQHKTCPLGGLDGRTPPEGNLAPSPYIELGIAVAQRFIDFAQKGGPDGRTSLAWSKMEFDEVTTVLDETERLLGGNAAFLNWQPPKPGTVKLKHGTFYEGGRPKYFAGYGHFSAVINDLPNFPTLGASLIQDGRAGPSSMNADGTLGEGAIQVLQGLDRAARFGMRTDFLLSPHYYPEWARAPDLANGNIGFLNFNIFHPTAKATMQKWAEVMASSLKNKPSLHSVCLANEPVYISSGRDSYTKPAFTEYLRQKHRQIAALNALYGTSYQSFDEVPIPPLGMPAAVEAQRAYYDWTSFNKKMFADWHAWLGSTLKEHGVKAPTHTKIMVFQTLDRDKLSHGVDPELMCRATDLAGCDAYAFPGGGYAYDWSGNEFFYDLLHSFRGQGVFNSENHVIPDGATAYHIPMSHTRSVLWQGGLHHQVSTTIWVWEVAADASLAGSIYFRPANVYGAGRAMLDLNRLAPEVTAINTAKPRVALLYSQPSIFWEPQYQGTLRSLYTVLSFMGENVTFVSERQLAESTAPKVEWLLVPNATHILPTTPKALSAFAKSGGKVLLVGKESLQRDEYDRPLNPAIDILYERTELAASEPATAADLRQRMTSLQLNDLRDSTTGQPAWGVEFRVVQFGRKTLVPLINFNNEARKVKLMGLAKRQALDLLSGETVDLNAISLETMSPRLLRIGKAR